MFRRSMRSQKEKAKARRTSAEADGPSIVGIVPPQTIVPSQTKKPKLEPMTDADAPPTPEQAQASMNRALRLVWEQHNPGQTFPTTPQGGKW